ncbi:rod-binding protein [Stakelama saccharophila]|uniref:Rod-binding protein n=1 Tax=Stakelama saccharophila TaxID=3075605 RepID=A0ABZ0B980_9SPHN|nr:rod-binding protein [Stakelama sp. W311]WNO53671.1 rod-binding protein [Stakelama sp. W311]
MTSTVKPDGVAGDSSRLNTRANLDQAGEQFEAIFVRMMLKSMRQANLADPLFDNKATEQFRDMQDQQLAQTMAATTPLGIGEAMTDFLGRAQGSADPVVTRVEPPTDSEDGGS